MEKSIFAAQVVSSMRNRMRHARTRDRNRILVRWRIALAVMLLISLSILAISCNQTERSSKKLPVAVSIFPLADFSRQIGGEKIEVRTLVPAGANPHTFEPAPSQIKFLSGAKVFVYNGLGLETWAREIASKTGGGDILLLPCAESVPREKLIKTDVHEDESHNSHDEADAGSEYPGGYHVEHRQGIFDPHVWLDPTLASYQVKAIASALSRIDPKNDGYYMRNAEIYIKSLKRLDIWISRKISSLRTRCFVATHPSLIYFARRYGLKQVASIEELPGKEPSVRHIRKIIEKMKKLNARVILVEKQVNPKAAEAIARESRGNVKIIKIDPLGNPEDQSANSYEKIIRKIVESLKEGMD